MPVDLPLLERTGWRLPRVRLWKDCSSSSLRLLHGLLESPTLHPLDGNGLDLFANPFLFEEAVEG